MVYRYRAVMELTEADRMNRIPPADSIGLVERIKLWMYERGWIDQTRYTNQQGGTTHIVRETTHAENVQAKA